MDLGYARVSTVKQDLDRQIDALTDLYRHLPPRAATTVTADSRAAETEATSMRVGAADAG
jgi:DNA invertase Pin-like site-specific DNA recombinase